MLFGNVAVLGLNNGGVGRVVRVVGRVVGRVEGEFVHTTSPDGKVSQSEATAELVWWKRRRKRNRKVSIAELLCCVYACVCG